MNFKMDINKYFTTELFNVEISTSFLQSMNISVTQPITDLSVNNVFVGTFPISGAGYTINAGTLMTLTPKPNSLNKYVPPYDILPFVSGRTTYAELYDLQSGLTSAFINFVDTIDGNNLMSDTTVNIVQNGNLAMITITINIKKTLSYMSYSVNFIDLAESTATWSIHDIYNSWAYNLKIEDQTINWSNAGINKSYALYQSKMPIYIDTITITNKDNKITFSPVPISNGGEGIYTDTSNNSVIVTIPPNEYSRDLLFLEINRQLALPGNNQITAGTIFSAYTSTDGGIDLDYTQISFNINKIYDSSDYRLVFYDPLSFATCNGINSSVQNTTWDSTLGWTMGFRENTEYIMSDLPYFNELTKTFSITGDTTVSVSIYNYFMIVLDDYNQSHMNAGVVTTAKTETDIPLPAYTNRALNSCDPITHTLINNGLSKSGTNLTANQIFAQQTIMNDQLVAQQSKKYSSGPFTKDVFALLPLKLAGLPNNSVYIESGGTLQDQERTYFGPVNISRMTVKLVNDRGETVNLNGADWSFSFICEQLYQNPTKSKI